MLHSRAYRLLVLGCPPTILAGCLLIVQYQPGYLFEGVAALAVASLALLYFAAPGRRQPTIPSIAAAVQQAPGSMLLVDLEGNVIWANTATELLLDRPADALAGEPLSALLTGPAWETLQGDRKRLLQGELIDLNGSIEHATGKPVSVHARAVLLRDARDKPAFIAVQLAPPASATALEALKDADAISPLDLASDLVFTLDQQGRIVQVNPSATRLLSRNGVPSLPGSSILDFIASDDRSAFIAAFKGCERMPNAPTEFEKLRLLCGGRGTHTRVSHPVKASIMGLPDPPGMAVLVCQDVHEHAASLAELRNSEARFSRIFHSSPDAILIVRREDSLILDFNSSFTRLLDYNREDAIGCLEQDLHLFESSDERDRILNRLEATGECTDIETRLKTRDGDAVTVEISLRYIEINGQLCTLCIGRDITKRVLAELAVRESEEKFAEVFSRSPDGIVILKTADLSIYDINDSFVLASGYVRSELLGRSITDLNMFDDPAQLSSATRELESTGRFSNREMRLLNKAGKPVQALVSATSIEINEVPCILCIAKNVDDLRVAEEKLRQSEQRFRGAFENSPIGIMLIDMKGRVFQANTVASEVLGYDVSPLTGVHISRLIPAEDRSHFKESLRRLVDGREDTVRTERRMLRSDSLEIWTNFHVFIQRGKDGKPLYLIGQIADITDMKHSQRRMERMAFYDTLTDLANRRLFYERLGHAVDHATRSHHLAALLYLDLDQFKRVNDTLGHEIGDVLLQEVSIRLGHCVRQEDTVARLGGDEFTVLLFDIRSPSDASLVAEKILTTLKQPLNISGHQLIITTSIGIAIIPQDGTEPNSLMKNADLAMYRAKDHGRNNYQFYSNDMNTDSVKRLRTEYELRRALDRNEFELYYQPKVRLESKRIVGVECLIRWNHPDRGVLPPLEFIEIAEETGAIVDIGSWIISEACATGKILSDQAGTDIHIAINISTRQFKDPNLVSTIRRALRETGQNPNMLEIEITETMLMSDVEAANQTVHQLHELGVKLAIDDFGTGYSSLNYLKKFPINTVKVDRSFITDIPESADDRAITSAVIAMAHRLNMEVVAEGVETNAQLEFLLDHDCEYGQGYLFSKPLNLSNLRSILQPPAVSPARVSKLKARPRKPNAIG